MIKRNGDTLPKLFFLGSLLVVVFGYGYVCHRYQFFPAKQMAQVEDGINELLAVTSDELPFHLARTSYQEKAVMHRPDLMQPGLTLISRMGEDDHLFVDIVDADGQLVHRWTLDWFTLWPDAKHLPEDVVPKSPPGTHIHGVVLMDNGDLIFNYEELGMVRVDIHGNVRWRLAYRTHHALWLDDKGHLWAPGMKTHFQSLPGMTNYNPRFEEHTIVEVSPDDGRILREISVFELFKKNNLQGLLYQESLNLHPVMTADTLHLNDIEVFPRRMKSGFFKPGDVMISLRNINAILVFDPKTQKKKFLSIGPYVRQHDPDFIDGNTISIFDNNDVGTPAQGVQSRIIKVSAPDGKVTVAFEGTDDLPFFTDMLGSHEWLRNGNLLVAESRAGRAFEVTPDGKLVWEYHNLVGDGITALLETAHRLPPRFTADFFIQQRDSQGALAHAAGAQAAPGFNTP